MLEKGGWISDGFAVLKVTRVVPKKNPSINYVLFT